MFASIRRSRLPVLAALALVVTAAAGTPVAAALPTDPRQQQSPEVEQTGEDGYRIVIGDSQTGIVVLLNLSLFTNLPRPGVLGFDAVGYSDGETIIEVDFGVRYEGAPGIGAFLGDPFSYFSTGYSSELHLPFLDGDAPDIDSDASNSSVGA